MEYRKILYYKVYRVINNDDLGFQLNVQSRKTDFDEEMTQKVVKFLGRNFFNGLCFFHGLAPPFQCIEVNFFSFCRILCFSFFQ